MKKVIVIVVKNGVKYQLGIKKSVVEIINELSASKSDFYLVHENCAIRVSEIVSVEQFEYEPEEESKEDD